MEKNQVQIKGNLFFTADTHFGHANIIKYCNRPFKNADEMDATIIHNINERVTENDTLFHLGDFSFGRNKDTNDAEKYLNRLRCQNVIVIPGNHDPHAANMMPKQSWSRLFAGCYPFYRLKAHVDNNPIEIFMFHYACRVWNKSHHGAWHLFGHSHGTLDDLPNVLSMDVGVDPNNFVPLSLKDIAKHMSEKAFTPIEKTKSKKPTDQHYKKWARSNGHT